MNLRDPSPAQEPPQARAHPCNRPHTQSASQRGGFQVEYWEGPSLGGEILGGPLPLLSRCIPSPTLPRVNQQEGAPPRSSGVQSSRVPLRHWLHTPIRLPFSFLLELRGRAESTSPAGTWPAPPLKLPKGLRTALPAVPAGADSAVADRALNTEGFRHLCQGRGQSCTTASITSPAMGPHVVWSTGREASLPASEREDL